MSARLPFNIVTSSKDSEDEKLSLIGSDNKDGSNKHCFYRLLRSYVWVWILILLSLFVLTVYALNPSRDSDIYPIFLLNSGDRIQLKSTHSDLYVRVSDATNSLVLDQNIPWKRGSTFEVEAAGECFLLRSLTGNFVRVDSEGVIRSSSQHRYGATHFTAVTKYVSPPAPKAKDFTEIVPTEVHLKVCKKNRWLQEATQSSTNPAPKSLKSTGPSEMVESDAIDKIIGMDTEAGVVSPKLPARATNIIVTAPVNVKAMSFGKPTVSNGVKYKSSVEFSVAEVSRNLRKLVGLSALSVNDQMDGTMYEVKDDVTKSGIVLKNTKPLLSAFEVIAVPQIRGINKLIEREEEIMRAEVRKISTS